VGRVALVTGGSRGIGRAIALELARRGNAVAVNYRSNESAALEVVDEMKSVGGSGIAVRADVGDSDEVVAMFQTVTDRLGPIEILVNNAGIRRDRLLARMGPDVWDEVVTTNLTSLYLCTKQAKEVGSRGITVNVVAPGFVDTDMTDDLSEDVKTAAAASIAVRRFGTPAEVASAVGYLASDEASYISGHVLVVDGGLAL